MTINYNIINMILVAVLVVALISFMNYTVNNIEAIKQSPLKYAESKLGGNCQCFCTDEEGFLSRIYNAEPSKLTAARYYINTTLLSSYITKNNS